MTALRRTIGVLAMFAGFAATTATAGILAAHAVDGIVDVNVPLAIATLVVAIVVALAGGAAATRP